MAKLTKALIRKYGISKKAWSMLRAGRSKTSRRANRTIKTKTRFYTMARRKYKAHRKGKSTGGMFGGGGLMSKAFQIIAGAGIAVLYEVFVSPMIPLSATIKNIVEFALGVFLAVSPRMPMIVRAGGAALATVNAYAFIAPFLSGSSSSSSSWD